MLAELIAGLNFVGLVLLLAGWRAIRCQLRDRHRRLMLANLGVAAVFLVLYVSQLVLVGHKRFPGDDWVRTAFLVLLGSHILAAVSLLPLVPVTVARALKQQFEAHRRIAQVTMRVWIYVSVTGVMVYGMVNHLRPAV
ncbi:MAG: DUF420 domain-containing protein [Deltaproteobacteria bacterium]|nr:DUF420 domain-containing protein [Deltaproteobacteria bacterium]MBW2420985.1 DUF420 domain-containing protein [Deltaproteobacteria bacterium]